MISHTHDEILETLEGALGRASNGRAKLDRLDDEVRIIEDIGLASLDVLELRYELEERWRMKIADAELAGMQTVGDVIHLIQVRSAASAN